MRETQNEIGMEMNPCIDLKSLCVYIYIKIWGRMPRKDTANRHPVGKLTPVYF